MGWIIFVKLIILNIFLVTAMKHKHIPICLFSISWEGLEVYILCIKRTKIPVSRDIPGSVDGKIIFH